MKELTLRIEGMSCSHCLNAVNKAIGGQPGVEVGSVQMGRAELRYDPSVTGPARIIAAVEEAGYHAVAGGG